NGSAVPWKATIGTARAGLQPATFVIPATGATAATRLASAHATTDVIIAPFDSPVTNTRAVSTQTVFSTWSRSSPMNFTSFEPTAVSQRGIGPKPCGVIVTKTS